MSDESSRPVPGRPPARPRGLDATAGYRCTARVLLGPGRRHRRGGVLEHGHARVLADLGSGHAALLLPEHAVPRGEYAPRLRGVLDAPAELRPARVRQWPDRRALSAQRVLPAAAGAGGAGGYRDAAFLPRAARHALPRPPVAAPSGGRVDRRPGVHDRRLPLGRSACGSRRRSRPSSGFRGRSARPSERCACHATARS